MWSVVETFFFLLSLLKKKGVGLRSVKFISRFDSNDEMKRRESFYKSITLFPPFVFFFSFCEDVRRDRFRRLVKKRKKKGKRQIFG